MAVAVGQTEDEPELIEDAIRKMADNKIEYEFKDLVWILKGTEKDLERIRGSFVSWETFFISRIS